MSAVILGGGPIGIGVFLGLRALGVEDVLVVEPVRTRRDAIAALGAPEVLDPRADDVVAAVRARTSGEGADRVFECAGVQASFAQALSVAGARGRVVMIAVYEDPIEWHPGALTRNEVELRAAMGYAPGVFETVIELMARGEYPTAGWVEHIPWRALVDEGLAPLRRGERMKVLVDVEA